MSILYRFLLTLTILSVLVAGCGQTKPTATPLPPTVTPTTKPATVPTATPIPPTTTPAAATDTPLSEATVTPTPPPATPTPQPTPSDEPAADTVAFADSGQELGEGRSTDVALGDLDGDGDLDALVGNQGQAQVWLNDGQAGFSPNGQDLTIPSGWNMGLDLGDLDEDGDLDAFIVVAEGPGRVLLNQGGAQGGIAGSFADSGQQLTDNSGIGFDLELGDLDGDGDLDAYVAHERANLVWLNDGQGSFQDSGQRLGEAITADVALADLDGDGDLDALAGGWDEPARVWLNDGRGTFSDSGHELTAAEIHIHGLDVGDVDSDGDLDVFLAIASGHPNQVWFNDGQGVFNDSGQRLHSSLGHAVVLGDLDGDGDLDAFMANAVPSAGAPNTVWLNDGQGTFSDSGLRLGNGLSYGLGLGDLDGDGDLDAFVANNSPPNAVWLNVRHHSDATLPPLLDGRGGGVIVFNLPASAGYNSDIYAINVAEALQDTDYSPLQRLTRHPADDFDPVWSPDGSQIAFVSERDGNQQIYVMNLADALQSTHDKDPQRLTDSDANDHSPAWSPDGKRIAFVSDREGNEEIYVMSVADALQSEGTDGGLQRLTDNKARDTAPDWSPDGSQIAFESNRDSKRQIYVMSADGSGQRRLIDSDANDYSPAWSPDGTQIAFHSSRDGGWEIFVMNSDGSNPRQLTHNEGQAADPIWSPDGGQILYSIHNTGKDPGLYIVNADGRNPRFLPAAIGGYQHDWHPFDTSLAAPSSQAAISADTADQVVQLHTLDAHTDRVYGLDFSSDGRRLASGSWDGTIRLWDVETWRQTHTFEHRGDGGVYWAAGDTLLASGDGKMWDVASGQELHSLGKRRLFRIAFSPDGRLLASPNPDGSITLQNVSDWEVIRTFQGHTDRVFGVDFSPDGSLLASGSGMDETDTSDYTVRIWDVAGGQAIHVLEGHQGDIHDVAFSPDGKYLASASTDYAVRVWDVQSGQLVHTLWHRDGLWRVAFSPDGSLLASGGVERTVRLWDVASGKLLHTLPHADEVMAIAFSPDGSLLATAGYDNLVYVWGISH